MRLAAIKYVAGDTLAYELRPVSGGAVPAYEAGAHVEVGLPNGMTRCFAVTSDDDVRDRYELLVAHRRDGRGASRYMHETLRVGTLLAVAAARTGLRLPPSPAPVALVASGIGVAALLGPARKCRRLGRPWTLRFHIASGEGRALLPDDVRDDPAVHYHVGPIARYADGIHTALARMPGDTHVLCCGAEALRQTVREATADWQPQRLQVLGFEADDRTDFIVELARSGKTLPVRPDQTILDALRAAGVKAPSFCGRGHCGVCETRVLEGTPEHHDRILSPDEKAAGTTMMICCSRSRTARLVLDL
jgi:vanillate O-demethylase ferredoxin subunit